MFSKVATHENFLVNLAEDMFINFRERGGLERERERCVREALIGCLLYAPKLRIEPSTLLYDLTGMESPNFWRTGQCSSQRSHVARSALTLLIV